VAAVAAVAAVVAAAAAVAICGAVPELLNSNLKVGAACRVLTELRVWKGGRHPVRDIPFQRCEATANDYSLAETSLVVPSPQQGWVHRPAVPAKADNVASHAWKLSVVGASLVMPPRADLSHGYAWVVSLVPMPTQGCRHPAGAVAT
jgi:hypothetical protein